MKHLLLPLLLLPFAAFTQKVKINEYDKFIKQRRIELEPLTILSSKTANVSLTYKSIGSTFYVLLSGFGWGEATIDGDNETIFLLSNDSTVTVKSTGIQTYSVSGQHNSYKHQYYIAQPDVEKLENYEVKGIRKYSISDYSDMDVPRESAEKIKKASITFIEELKKARVLFTLKDINLKDIANYVDDSVRFCSKVFNTRYFASSAGKPTILDVNEDYNNQLLTTIIWDEDRKNFGNAPDSLYQNKEVCISGVVRLVNNKPQIVLRKRDQITVTSPISLAEVPMFVGDSVTVRGKVFSGKYFSNGNNEFMLLNMGAAYPNQLLTVMLEDLDKKNLTGEQLENFFLNKELSVTGKITLFKDKPQVVIHKKGQMEIMAADATASAGTANFTLVAQPVASAPQKAVTIKDKAAEFPGGLDAFKLFLNKNLQAPSELKVGQQKTVIVQFLIDADGTAKQWQIAQSGGNNFDKEAIRVLKRMPKWVPAWQNGHPMAISVTQPITFVGVSE